MVQMLETRLTRWNFDDNEEIIARIFPDLQYKHIQNELAIAVEQRARLPVNPSNVNEYLMETEYLRGRVEILEYLLATHQDATDRLYEKAKSEAAIGSDSSGLGNQATQTFATNPDLNPPNS